MKSRTAPTHILGFAPGFKRMDALPGSHQTIIDAKIADSTEWMSPLPTREVTSVQQIETSGNVDNAPVLVQAPVQQSPIVAPVKQPIPVAPVVQTPVIQPTPQEIPKPQPQPVAQVYAVPKPIPQRIDIPAQFTELGYARENQKGITVLTKITDCEVFIAKFMYYVDTEIGTWSFKVSKVEGTRQMEFSTGHGVDSLLRHLNMPMKINARAAAKHL
jgi:hypothetical protein